MEFADMRAAARCRIDTSAWHYYQATADDDIPADWPAASPDAARDGAPEDPAARDCAPANGTRNHAPPDPAARDIAAWNRITLTPRVLTGAGDPDAATWIPGAGHRGGARLRTPVMVAPTAGHGMAHADAELATGGAAAQAGALMVYSNSATVDVTTFGAAMRGPWWAQVYVHRDRVRSNDYLTRAVTAGAGAIVLTADLRGNAADAPFRRTVQPATRLGNYPDLPWSTISSRYESSLTPESIGEITSRTSLPVYVKGILHPDDADRAIEAGAAGIIVSNHGRRQLTGVIPSADALGPIVDAAAGRVPVLVDGGIRSGTDVVRALTLGADLVGIGRPVLWALAAGGREAVRVLLDDLTAETAQTMAAMGAGNIQDLRIPAHRHTYLAPAPDEGHHRG
jgi:4-hydroxymandelate oxidase